MPLEFVQGTGQEFGQASLFGNAVGMIQRSGGLFSASRTNGGVGSNNIGTNAGGAGSGLNACSNPEAVYHSFRKVELSRDTRVGNPRAFGVLNSQINLPRYIQLGLRFEW